MATATSRLQRDGRSVCLKGILKWSGLVVSLLCSVLKKCSPFINKVFGECQNFVLVALEKCPCILKYVRDI